MGSASYRLKKFVSLELQLLVSMDGPECPVKHDGRKESGLVVLLQTDLGDLLDKRQRQETFRAKRRCSNLTEMHHAHTLQELSQCRLT